MYDSKISDSQEQDEFIHIDLKIKEMKLVYRGSRDGFGAVDFHSKCDETPNNITLIKSSTGQIFGGFTTKTWDG